MSLEHIKRRNQMLRMRARGATYEEIAAKFNITRQRAHQILMETQKKLSTVRKESIDRFLTD